MKFSKFDLYHQDYSQSFFKNNFLRTGLRKTELMLAETPKPRFGQAWFGAKAVKMPDPADSRAALSQHIGETIESRSPDQIMRAAKNVARFNEVYADLAPLAHPALERPKRGADAVKQLAFELRTIEHQYESQREAHAVDVENWSTFSADGKIGPYQRRIKAVLLEEVPRIEEKYRHVSLIAQAALTAAETAHALSSSQPEGNKAFTLSQRDALRSLYREVKRSLAVAKLDLETIHGMYARAQSATLQLASVDVRGPVPARLLPIRLDNLLGPGQIVAQSSATALELRRLVQDFLKTIGTLDNPVLRRRITELSAAQTVLGQALRGTQSHPFLGKRFNLKEK